MTAEAIRLTGEKETLLITLYCKAEESRLADSLLHDHFAAEVVSRIDYDFAKLHVDRDMMIGVSVRAHILDGWTHEFIAKHPDGTVLHLGCGLDSRIFRIDPPPGIRWFDIDQAEVIALRDRLYPARDGYGLIGASVTSVDWLDEVPTDRPILILAEGLLPYLPEEEVLPLLDRLTRLDPGGELAFDAYNRFGLMLIGMQPSIRATGAQLHWSIEDPSDLEAQLPQLTLITDLKSYDSAWFGEGQAARLSWFGQLTLMTFAMVPPLANLGRILRYRF